MFIRYDTAHLSKLIKNLFDLTGISISVLDKDYQVLAHYSRPNDFCSVLQRDSSAGKRCMECDQRILEKCRHSGKLEGHICTAGLYDSAMPIIKHDTIVGYVIMGRVRSAGSPAALPYAGSTDAATQKALQQLYDQIPMLTGIQLAALYDLLPSVLFDKAIQIIHDPLATEIAEYIQSHLAEDLSVGALCRRFHISVNHLYNLFHTNFDRSVQKYITEQRMVRAKELLLASREPIYEIAEKVGVDNYTYFCKLFKKQTGCSPLQFRAASLSETSAPGRDSLQITR